MNSSLPIKVSLLAILALCFLSGCITKRTVTQGNQTVSSTYVIKRPIKEAIENSRNPQ